MTRFRRLIKVRRARAVVAVAAISALVVGCGGGASSSGKSGTTSAAGPTAAPSTGASTVTIASFAYSPSKITVTKGTTVTFDNKDNAEHTVTADNGSFDSGTLQLGASKTISFSKPGTFAFHCSFHPFMHGTVIVK